MKNLLIVLLFITINSQCQTADKPLAQLSWLEGQWQRTNAKSGQTAYETWEMISDVEMRGIGVTIKGQDTVFVEKLQLLSRDGSVFYSADVDHNADKVYFKLTTLTDHTFVSENAEHDFPNKIGYELTKEKTLRAFISDMSEKKKMYFEFTKLE